MNTSTALRKHQLLGLFNKKFFTSVKLFHMNDGEQPQTSIIIIIHWSQCRGNEML